MRKVQPVYRIQITSGDIRTNAVFNESPTARAIWKVLPLEAETHTWGDEIYFPIPVQMEESDDSKEVVEMGNLGYWPQGHAFCIFFGPTPASRGDEIRAASAVNIVGNVEGNPLVFKNVSSGSPIRIERA